MSNEPSDAPNPSRPEAPYCRAAFINAIAEEGTKAEAVEWLQKTWNELCEARAEIGRLRSARLIPILAAREVK